MPNDDSTPEMFENRNGLSSVTTVSSQTSPFCSSETCTSSGLDVARQPRRGGRWRRVEQPQVARGSPSTNLGISASADPPAGAASSSTSSAWFALDQLVAVAERQLVVGVDVQPPEQLFLPRCERLGADRVDVGQRQQAEHLQSLFDADQRARTAGRRPGLRCRGGTRPATSGGGCAIRNSHRLARVAPAARRRSRMSAAMRTLSTRDRRRATCRRRAAAARAPAARASGARAGTELKRSRARPGGEREPLEVADREQRVLVDRVLVVEVAHHPARDRAGTPGRCGRAVRSRASPTAARTGPAAASETASSAPRSRGSGRNRSAVALRRAAECTRARRRRRRCRDRSPPGTRRATCPAIARPPPAIDEADAVARLLQVGPDRHRRRRGASTRATGSRFGHVGSNRPSAARRAAAAARPDIPARPPSSPAARG